MPNSPKTCYWEKLGQIRFQLNWIFGLGN